MKEKILSIVTQPGDLTWEQITTNIAVAALLGFFMSL